MGKRYSGADTIRLIDTAELVRLLADGLWELHRRREGCPEGFKDITDRVKLDATYRLLQAGLSGNTDDLRREAFHCRAVRWLCSPAWRGWDRLPGDGKEANNVD